MGKVKVGDKFEIITGGYFKEGEIVELIELEEDGVHLYSNGEEDYYLADSKVERLKFQVGDKDEVTRYPELKVGQVVEMYDYSENKEYLAMITHAKGMFEDGTGEPIIALTSKHTWFPVEEFNDELKYVNHEVRKLYGYSAVKFSNDISTEDRTLIWERQVEDEEIEVKEMTLQEVIDELGYEIKIKK